MFCTRPWRQIAILSDGSAVCSCIDAEKTNPLGNITTQSMEEIWNGPRFRALRKAVVEDINRIPICRGCPNRVEGPPAPADFIDGVPKPRLLFIEAHGGCNLACPGCSRDGIEGSRTSLAMDFATFQKTIDELSPGLEYMEFHIGGENYMNKQANEMVRYCRDKNPTCKVLTSTNGHFFHTEERRQELLDSGVDCVIFSVDGASQESYEKYRVNGKLERVLDGMRRIAELKKGSGQERPVLVWRYILFDWNDSQEEMALARKMAAEVGVDFLAWHLNGVDSQQASKRYYVGSPHLGEIEHELWDTLMAQFSQEVDLRLDTYH